MSEPKSPREIAAEKFANDIIRDIPPTALYTKLSREGTHKLVTVAVLEGWDACLAHHAKEREASESLAAAFESIIKRAQLMFFITEVEHIDDFLKDARLAIKAYRKAKERG